MGQRANLVVVQDQDWSLYYDHWCANRLDVELFWGPAHAWAFVKEREPLPDRNDWLNDVWCEGGAVIDYDKKVVLWFGGEEILYDVVRRRAFMPLMQRQWPGWEVRWASGHIAELGAYVGVPAGKLVAEDDMSTEGGFRQSTEYPEENGMLLSVLWNGEIAATRVWGDADTLVAGESLLPGLLSFPRTPRIEFTGEVETGGIHIDLDSRALYCWSAQPVAAFLERVGSAWPGWQCVWLGDQYEEHLQIASGTVQFVAPATAVLQRRILEHLKMNCDQAPSNPALELGRKIGAETISPWTHETRGSVGSSREKLRILSDLEAMLPISPTDQVFRWEQ